MQLWGIDIVGGIELVDTRTGEIGEAKLVTGIDDHSQFLARRPGGERTRWSGSSVQRRRTVTLGGVVATVGCMTHVEGTATSRVLVVANQTVMGSELHEAIKTRLDKGPCQFTLLVPATPAAREDEYEYARKRLEFGLEQLRRLGADVDGDVGDPNALKAIEDALARRQYDEIILSTLPSGISRWLSQDLPHRVTRKFHLPVAVVTAAAKPGR